MVIITMEYIKSSYKTKLSMHYLIFQSMFCKIPHILMLHYYI